MLNLTATTSQIKVRAQNLYKGDDRAQDRTGNSFKVYSGHRVANPEERSDAWNQIYCMHHRKRVDLE